MDKVIEKAKELRKELDSLPLFQEYKRVKDSIESDQEIQELKKQIVRAKSEGRLEDHKRLLNEYNSHPLVNNLNRLEEEVKNYLTEISEILNEKWWNSLLFCI